MFSLTSYRNHAPTPRPSFPRYCQYVVIRGSEQSGTVLQIRLVEPRPRSGRPSWVVYIGVSSTSASHQLIIQSFSPAVLDCRIG